MIMNCLCRYLAVGWLLGCPGWDFSARLVGCPGVVFSASSLVVWISGMEPNKASVQLWMCVDETLPVRRGCKYAVCVYVTIVHDVCRVRD